MMGPNVGHYGKCQVLFDIYSHFLRLEPIWSPNKAYTLFGTIWAP